MSDDDLVTVATFGSAIEADMAKSMLASEGINALLGGGVSLGLMPFLAAGQGIEVKVAQRDAERAREILAPSAPEKTAEPYR